MKLLVFAHIPPPHHGQSYMVKLLLDAFGGDRRKSAPGTPESDRQTRAAEIECYHVDCRYSESLEDIGSFRLGKFWLVLQYCLDAIWCRFRYGVRTFYYVPAPGKRSALYRDWVVMLLCRPFFREVILHWHAVGLGDWLDHEATWLERWITHRLLGRPELGIALATPSMRDALWFLSQRVEIVPNGIPDPCPGFEDEVKPQRLARLRARESLLKGASVEAVDPSAPPPPVADAATFRLLYLAHCTREKGLFDSLDAVALANSQLRNSQSPLRCHLTVAGLFPREDEEAEFRRRISQPDLVDAVEYVGFVDGAAKSRHLCASDALCFPTYYHAESFGLVVVEAMAAGLAVVTTRWRALPELLPPDHPGFVPPRQPAALARALVAAAVQNGTALRARFEEDFAESRHIAILKNALQRAEAAPAAHLGQP